jgi:hypothetical protein
VSKSTRRATPDGSRRPSAPAGAPPSGPDRPTTRVGRRERTRLSRPPSFAERFRGLIVVAVVISVVAVVGAFVVASASAKAYDCSTLFDPEPTAAPAPDRSPQPGYVQEDMGRRHVAVGDPVTYTYCPPASGSHYFRTGSGPITSRVYGPGDDVIPQGWIHNLEHGGLVILYRGDSDGATEAGQQAFRRFFDTFPPSPLCGFPAGQSLVIARFDEMATPFYAVIWGRVLPLETFDEGAVMEFWNTFGERTNPEPFCERTTPPPDPSPTGG